MVQLGVQLRIASKVLLRGELSCNSVCAACHPTTLNSIRARPLTHGRRQSANTPLRTRLNCRLTENRT